METYKFSNPHPQHKIVRDCVKRAITHATSRDYQDVSRELNRIKREMNALKYNHQVVWSEFFLRHGYIKTVFQAVKGRDRMNGYSFAESHPTGSYILRMSHHLSSCVDGVILDTFDCRDKCVYAAYKVK